ncbi:hypothetical protein SRABI89_03115 [Pseudomonas koreensis]|jgi:hypothetical protein|nr:hypothetical protein SRABI89_03115 [Pseudomonas koreensis]
MTHKTLLTLKHTNPVIRLLGRCDPMSHAARTVTTIAGH